MTRKLSQLQKLVADTLGWEEVSDEESLGLLSKAEEVLAKRIMVVLLSRLNEDERSTLTELLADNEDDDTALKFFLREAVEAHRDEIRQELENFLSEMKEAAQG